MRTIIFSLLFLFSGLFALAQTGSITNIQVSQRTDGSGLVDIYFNLSGEANAYNILLEISFEGGDNYVSVPSSFLTGDVDHISPGEQKHIIWDGIGSFPNTYSAKAQLRIIASASGYGGNGLTGQPCPGMPTFTDQRDGNVYNTVQIGDQCWLKENLKYLPEVSPSSAHSYTDPHYYVYDYQGTSVSEAKATDNYRNYGVLYNWAAAMDGEESSSANPSGVQGVCPAGWYLPSHNDWTKLDRVVCETLGNSDCETKFPLNHYTLGWRGTNEGNALKSCRQVGSPLGGECATSDHPRWNSHGTQYGTDQFGFSALPAGGVDFVNNFHTIGYGGIWWSSTEHSGSPAWGREMNLAYGNVYIFYPNKQMGVSVRCFWIID